MNRSIASYYYEIGEPSYQTDIDFYKERIMPQMSVLELGSGCGRVLFELAPKCKSITGVEINPEYWNVAVSKYNGPDKVTLINDDMENIDLEFQFDLIIAPWRVFQLVDPDKFFNTVKRHLKPRGRAIVSSFQFIPEMCEIKEMEFTFWNRLVPEVGHLQVTATIHKFTEHPYKLHSTMKYKNITTNEIVEEKTTMYCYTADNLVNLIESKGFIVIDKFGNYDKTTSYGKGPELIVEFSL